jgi:hypothetical protein
MKTTSSKTENRILALLIALTLVMVMAVALPSALAEDITIASLAGPWTVSYFSNGECGVGTHVQIFTLNSSGVSTPFGDSYDTSVCGIGENHDQTFTINKVDADGTGTATFSNNGNPLTFMIQVSPSKSIFSLVEVTSSNSQWLGTAVKQ